MKLFLFFIYFLAGIFFVIGYCAADEHLSLQKQFAFVSALSSDANDGVEERGVASWYGPGFYGRKTASGERLQKDAFTCAHRLLPFGTRLQVTNLENNKSVEVVVNDRGPFHRKRNLDLSYAAAKAIGILEPGKAKVKSVRIKNEEF